MTNETKPNEQQDGPSALSEQLAEVMRQAKHKKTKNRLYIQLGGIAIGVTGFILLSWQTSWIAALSVFLLLWGNNLEQNNR